MIFFAVAGPTPGRASSCAWDAGVEVHRTAGGSRRGLGSLGGFRRSRRSGGRDRSRRSRRRRRSRSPSARASDRLGGDARPERSATELYGRPAMIFFAVAATDARERHELRLGRRVEVHGTGLSRRGGLGRSLRRGGRRAREEGEDESASQGQRTYPVQFQSHLKFSLCRSVGTGTEPLRTLHHHSLSRSYWRPGDRRKSRAGTPGTSETPGPAFTSLQSLLSLESLLGLSGAQSIESSPWPPRRRPPPPPQILPSTTSGGPPPRSRSGASTRRGTWQQSLIEEMVGDPGQFPFTRGVQPKMYRRRLWTMRQYAGFGTGGRVERALPLPAGPGARPACRSPSTCRRRWATTPTTRCARGEVGRVGVAIDSLEDMRLLLRRHPARPGHHLDDDQRHGGHPALPSTSRWPRSRACRWEKLAGTVQNDILKEYIGARHVHLSAAAVAAADHRHLRLLRASEVPKWNTISISGYHIREAGSTAVQEIAFTLANGIAYVEAALERGARRRRVRARGSPSSSTSTTTSSRRWPSSAPPAGCGPRS